MAFEDDRRLSTSGPGQAGGLLTVLAKHLGDSRLVEMAHQQAKDLFRTNKNVSFGNTSIMSKILASEILQNRGISVAKASVSDKVTAPAPGKAGEFVSLGSLMKASTHKLPKSMQELMVPRKKQDEWPSTPAALFDSAAATAWLMHYWPQKDSGSWPETLNVNMAVVSHSNPPLPWSRWWLQRNMPSSHGIFRWRSFLMETLVSGPQFWLQCSLGLRVQGLS